MYVVTVEFKIDPPQWESFLPLMVENARASRETEPGCRQFDVCAEAAKPATVFLYELYDDRAAFDAHRETPHFRSFSAAAKGMIIGSAVQTWERLAP